MGTHGDPKLSTEATLTHKMYVGLLLPKLKTKTLFDEKANQSSRYFTRVDRGPIYRVRTSDVLEVCCKLIKDKV